MSVVCRLSLLAYKTLYTLLPQRHMMCVWGHLQDTSESFLIAVIIFSSKTDWSPNSHAMEMWGIGSLWYSGNPCNLNAQLTAEIARFNMSSPPSTVVTGSARNVLVLSLFTSTWSLVPFSQTNRVVKESFFKLFRRFGTKDATWWMLAGVACDRLRWYGRSMNSNDGTWAIRECRMIFSRFRSDSDTSIGMYTWTAKAPSMWGKLRTLPRWVSSCCEGNTVAVPGNWTCSLQVTLCELCKDVQNQNDCRLPPPGFRSWLALRWGIDIAGAILSYVFHSILYRDLSSENGSESVNIRSFVYIARLKLVCDIFSSLQIKALSIHECLQIIPGTINSRLWQMTMLQWFNWPKR